MTPIQYNNAKEDISSIRHLNPPIEEIAKYVNIMYQSLCQEWGLLCKQDILVKLVNDLALIGFSETKIKQLLLWEEC